MNKNEKKRDSFVFYRSFYEAINELESEEQLSLYRSIADYSLNGIEPELKGTLKSIWKLIKPQLDANWLRYKNGCKGGERGSKGGAPIGNKNALKKRTDFDSFTAYRHPNESVARIDDELREIKARISECGNNYESTRILLEAFKEKWELRKKILSSIDQ